jgi:hypothetical protein
LLWLPASLCDLSFFQELLLLRCHPP